jgi:hypothetical protein
LHNTMEAVTTFSVFGGINACRYCPSRTLSKCSRGGYSPAKICWFLASLGCIHPLYLEPRPWMAYQVDMPF